MIRSITRQYALGLTVCVAAASTAAAQALPGIGMRAVSVQAAVPLGELYGTIRDNQGQPLTGAIVSALGSKAAYATSDREGRFVFRSLPPGPYLLRAHLDGYVPPRGRYVQVNAGGREMWTISMDRVATAESPVFLTAGVGVEEASPAAPTAETDDDGEVAWRLRHLKRGVLKETDLGLLGDDEGDLAFSDPRGAFGRAMDSSARLGSLIADLTLNGQINLLTTTSFDRPQDLFSTDAGTPRPVAYVSLVAPTSDGDYTVRGSMTQGDIASWILAGSFMRRGPATHLYEAGLSYATQRYQGGNAQALAAMRDGSRYAGELYGTDTWTIAPQWTIGLGGKYASYGYLEDRALLSGRLSVAFQPSPTDPLRLSVSATHREMAPGAEEFVPPSTGLWLPPERTFSDLSDGVFRPERLNHVEVAGEREVLGHVIVGARAFRQQVDDQLVTLFGVAVPESSTTLGHYQVGSAGEFESYGWGLSVTRAVSGGTSASIVYTQVDAHHRGDPADADLLEQISPSLVRRKERVHDLAASVTSRLDVTATRVFVVYKLNSAYAEADAVSPVSAARFEVQVNQEIPFLDFTGASWEMLVGVRNLFRSDLFEGGVYDELLVLRPPKRVMGGVTVRF